MLQSLGVSLTRVFLSSTRVIFAAAFDRMLPEWVSKIESRTRTPVNALLLMVIPSVIISILYAYNIWKMQSIVLDATLVIAITFSGRRWQPLFYH
jgi:amino acid transporter